MSGGEAMTFRSSCTHESCCVPPPCPSPVNGGGDEVAPPSYCCGPRFCTAGNLPHVAALGIFQRGGAEIDPIGGGEIADRHRLVLLQRHQDDFPVLGRFPARKGHVLDLVAFSHDGLERLLLLREGIAGLRSEHGSGERA